MVIVVVMEEEVVVTVVLTMVVLNGGGESGDGVEVVEVVGMVVVEVVPCRRRYSHVLRIITALHGEPVEHCDGVRHTRLVLVRVSQSTRDSK